MEELDIHQSFDNLSNAQENVIQKIISEARNQSAVINNSKIDRAKSQLINIKDIKSHIPEHIEIIDMEEDILEKILEARIGVELWRYFLYGVILLLIIEMILSNAKKQR